VAGQDLIEHWTGKAQTVGILTTDFTDSIRIKPCNHGPIVFAPYRWAGSVEIGVLSGQVPWASGFGFLIRAIREMRGQ
jgi:hypothetical protein